MLRGGAALPRYQDGAPPENVALIQESYVLKLWTEAYAHYLVAIGRRLEGVFDNRMRNLVAELQHQYPGVKFKKAPLKRLERVVEKTKEDWLVELSSCACYFNSAQ